MFSARAKTNGLLLFSLVMFASGCHTMAEHHHQVADWPKPLPSIHGPMPREKSKVVLPDYVVEPPDILTIQAVHLVPRSPYNLRTGDVVAVQVEGALPDAPIAGAVPIQPGGMIQFGPPYGAVQIAGMTVDEAQVVIRDYLRQYLRDPIVSLGLVEMTGLQQIAGQHLVGPDGTVTMGSYGKVPVVGLTVPQVKETIEAHLSQFLEDPEIAVDVFAYNSKVYYVITEGAGLGDTVTRFPITGNETVLDAISNINGLTQVSSKRIWISRPTPHKRVLVMPVDYRAITAHGQTLTNYQILPGDRVFVAEDKVVAFDTGLAKITAPIERIFGFTLLGRATVASLSGDVLQQNFGGLGGGFGF